ncbi:protein phosphatase 2C domain-containing protein [Microlunatus speluncae]|uniref:protein phosphatase 2C domain-containing protein n=1 Tax=Microlunatus speluncae TaxID=2594267 RepID=UPI0012661B64|nr:protein phosphatase 2C domain-containing protein [Microlunatus speluncae]
MPDPLRHRIATLPGTPDRPNEDYADVKGNVAVLLDGAGIKAVPTGCRHNVHWFVQQLGPAVLTHAAGAMGLDEALRRAINQVRELHVDTCDLDHPYSPAATAIIVRVTEQVEALLLADSTLVVRHPDEQLSVITDERFATLQARLISEGVVPKPGWMGPYINRPEGYWMAGAVPVAADNAVLRSWPADQVSSLVLLSDGATRPVDLFHRQTWPELINTVAGEGPGRVLEQVRVIEDTDPEHERWPRAKTHDDATILAVDLG